MSQAPQQFDPGLSAAGLRIAIVVSRFNSAITERLLAGALEAIKRAGGDPQLTDVFRVPGAWELPLIGKTLADRARHDAIVCLGAVIRGDTPHFDFVAGEAARGIASLALQYQLPIAFGVLTTNTVEQAEARAGGAAGNRGFDAALTAIEMAGLIRRLRMAD
jgi:6,7-dimethyl-8-ribityllumazine synthase